MKYHEHLYIHMPWLPLLVTSLKIFDVCFALFFCNLKVKSKKGKLGPVYKFKAHLWCRPIAPLVHKLGIRCYRVFNFTARLLYSLRNELLTPIEQQVGWASDPTS